MSMVVVVVLVVLLARELGTIFSRPFWSLGRERLQMVCMGFMPMTKRRGPRCVCVCVCSWRVGEALIATCLPVTCYLRALLTTFHNTVALVCRDTGWLAQPWCASIFFTLCARRETRMIWSRLPYAMFHVHSCRSVLVALISLSTTQYIAPCVRWLRRHFGMTANRWSRWVLSCLGRCWRTKQSAQEV